MEQFAEQWDEKYPQISKTWRSHWHNLNTLFRYPEDIRKAIYTTNAIESLNSVIRKAVKKRKLFPTDDAAKKSFIWRDRRHLKNGRCRLGIGNRHSIVLSLSLKTGWLSIFKQDSYTELFTGSHHLH